MTYKQRIILNYLLFGLGLALFLLPLIDAWMLYPLKGLSTGQTRYSALGGIIPWSDAAGYYEGANMLLYKGFLAEWPLRRPLNAILLATRLFMVDFNFKAALILQALLCGSSCLLVVVSIVRRFSKGVGFIALCVLFMFAKIFIPSTLSESLGLSLGCLAFVFLWEAMITKRLWLFFFAGLMLMLGLNARAGAFFVPPILVVWLGFYFRDKNKGRFFCWPIASVFGAGLMIASLLNVLFTALCIEPGQPMMSHGNFACVLFGLVSGGKGWLYAYTTYPGFPTEAAFAKHVYAESWVIFKNNPALLLIGVLKNWAQMFRAPINLFQVLMAQNRFLAVLLYAGLFGFILRKTQRFWVFYTHAIKAQQSCMMLVGVVLLGMMLSAGFIWMDGNSRVFAVTVPFFAAALGIIITLLFTKQNNAFAQNPANHSGFSSTSWEIKGALVLSVTLILAALLTPLLARHFHKPNTLVFNCSKHERAMIVNNIAGAPYVYLRTENGAFAKKLVYKNFGAIESNLLKNLKPGDSAQSCLALIYDQKVGHLTRVVAPINLFAHHNASVGLCTVPIPGNELVIQVKTFEVFNEP